MTTTAIPAFWCECVCTDILTVFPACFCAKTFAPKTQFGDSCLVSQWKQSHCSNKQEVLHSGGVTYHNKTWGSDCENWTTNALWVIIPMWTRRGMAHPDVTENTEHRPPSLPGANQGKLRHQSGNWKASCFWLSLTQGSPLRNPRPDYFTSPSQWVPSSKETGGVSRSTLEFHLVGLF